MQHRTLLCTLVLVIFLLISGFSPYTGEWLAASAQAEAATAEAGESGGPWTNFGDSLRAPILTMVAGANNTLWIGSKSGVSVRDVNGNWLTLTTSDGLAGSTVFAILHDPQNPKLHWIGTNRGASLLDDGGNPMDKSKHRWISFTKEDGMANSRVSSVAITPQGTLWFGLSYVDLLYCDERGDGIAVLDTNGTPFDKSDDSWSSMTATNSNLANNVIRRMTTDANGNIWISMQGTLSAYQNGNWISYSTDQGLPSNDITALTIVDSKVWIGMRQGFGVLDYGKSLTDRSDDQWQSYQITDTTSSWQLTDVSALAVDGKGRVWIGRNDFNSLCYDNYDYGNAYLFDPKGTLFDLKDDEWKVITDTQATAIRAIELTNSGAIFANRTEIQQLDYGASPFDESTYQWHTILTGDGINGTTASAAGSNFAHDPSILFFVQDGSLYKLEHHSTLHDRNDDTYTYIASVSSATSVLVDKKGYVWVGGSGIDIINPNEYWYDPYLAYYPKGFGLISSRINDMVMDEQGWVWIASGDTFEGGLNVLDAGASLSDVRDDRWATFTAQQNGVLGDQITAVALADNKIAWIGSNKGLAKLSYGASPFDKSDDSWEHFTTANSGITNNFVRDLAVDSNGNLWVALAAGGVSVYTKDGQWFSFGERDGLAYNSLNAIGIDSKDRVWLGTDGEGVSVLNYTGTLQNKADDKWITYRPGEAVLSGYIRTIYVDPWDEVWVGTFAGGLSAYFDGEIKHAYLPLISKNANTGSVTVTESR